MLHTFLLIFTLLILLFLCFLLAFAMFSSFYSSRKGSPFISNDMKVVKGALKLADLKSNDVLVDLGSGDGRVLVTAIRDFKVKKAIGYEVSPLPYLMSKYKIKFLNKDIENKISLHKKSIKLADQTDDFSQATVIYLYLFPKIAKEISPKLHELKKQNKDLRIVSVAFALENIKPIKKESIYHPTFRKEIEVYLY